MARESRRNMPEILSRLRADAEKRMQEPLAPRWARPVGLLVALGIVAVVVVMVLTANPL